MNHRKTLITLGASGAILAGSILLGTIATGQSANELARPVTLSNTPVPVVNDGTNPLLVKAPTTPIHISCSASFGTGEVASNNDCYTVPTGKRLVIEEVSFTSVGPTSHPVTEMTWTTTTGGVPADFQLLVSDRGEAAMYIGSHLYAGGQLGRSYAQANTFVGASAGRAVANGAAQEAFFSFAGYLENVP